MRSSRQKHSDRSEKREWRRVRGEGRVELSYSVQPWRATPPHPRHGNEEGLILEVEKNSGLGEQRKETGMENER